MGSTVRTATASASSFPASGTDLLARDRTTGDLLRFRNLGPDGYGEPERIGGGFGPETVPVLAAAPFAADGRTTGAALWCAGPAGTVTAVPNRSFFDAADCLTGPADGSLAAIVPLPGGGLLTQRTGATTIQETAAKPDSPAGTVATVTPGAVLVGAGDVTGAGRADIVVEEPDGRLAVLERTGAAGDWASRWYRCGAVLPGLHRLAIGDVTGDGLADCLGVRTDGALLAYRHSGVFWPQDPDTVFLSPIVIAAGWGKLDILH